MSLRKIKEFVVLMNIVFLVGCASQSVSHAEGIKIGNKYETKVPINIAGIYNSSTMHKDRSISKKTVKAYLSRHNSSHRYFTAFQTTLPIGTKITIIGVDSWPWYVWFAANKYIVKLEPDLSKNLDVVLVLNAGMEGSLDGELNPEVFKRAGD